MCWVTKIKKDNEYQYIYIYTRCSYIPFGCEWGISISYEFSEFQKGTFLVDIYGTDSYVSKKYKNGEDISEYYNYPCTITHKGVSINKISDEAISLEIIEHYFKNKDLPRPEAIVKILSVFKPEFDIYNFEQEH